MKKNPNAVALGKRSMAKQKKKYGKKALQARMLHAQKSRWVAKPKAED